MIILRWFISAASLILVSYVVPGFQLDSFFSALMAALILGLANIIVRPILLVVTLPINIVTFGLFTFIVNALTLWFVSTVVKGFTVADFKAAFLGALVLTAIGWAADYIGRTSESGQKNTPDY